MRAYRVLLRLFPKSFRHEYGSEMVRLGKSNVGGITPDGSLGPALGAMRVDPVSATRAE